MSNPPSSSTPPPHCPYCGAVISMGARFCKGCGRPVAAGGPAGPAPAAPAPHAARTPSAHHGRRWLVWGALGLCLALLLALVLWATAGGGLDRLRGRPRLKPLVSQTLQPSTVAQAVQWQDQVRVVVPGGLLGEEATLTISAVSNAPPMAVEGFTAGNVFDVSLGSLHAFSLPLTIELAYDPASLSPDLPPEDQLVAAHWDPDAQVWAFLPAEVDPVRHRITLQTRHLSPIGWYYINVEKFFVKKTDHFRIIYDPTLQSRILVEGNPQYGMERYAHYAGVALEEAYQSYAGAGFTMSGSQIDVLVGDWKTIFTWDIFLARREPLPSYWSPAAGAIYLITGADYQELSFDAAHELFHMVQYEYLDLNEMDGLRWWMEATADYAAGRLARPEGSAPSSMMGEGIRPNYLEQSLEFSSENGSDPHYRHQYHTAHFVDFLVEGVRGSQQAGPVFLTLWTAVADEINRNDYNHYSPFAEAEDFVNDWNVLLHLDGWLAGRLRPAYLEFTQFFLFNRNSPLVTQDRGKVPAAAVSGGWTTMSQDEHQVRREMALAAHYAARLWGVVPLGVAGDPARRLFVSVVGDLPAGVELYVYLLNGEKRVDLGYGQGPVPVGRVAAAGEQFEVSVAAGQDLFVLAVNYHEAAQRVTIQVSDQPKPTPTAAATAVPTTGTRINRMRLGATVPAGWDELAEPLSIAVRGSVTERIETFTGIRPGENPDASWKAGLVISGGFCENECAGTTAEELAHEIETRYQDWHPVVTSGALRIGELSGFYAEGRSHTTDPLYNLASFECFFVARVWAGDATFRLSGHVSVDARSDKSSVEAEHRFEQLVGELWSAIHGLQVTLSP